MPARLSRLYNQHSSGTTATRHGPGLGPQRQATGPFVGSKVEDTVQGRAVARPLLIAFSTYLFARIRARFQCSRLPEPTKPTTKLRIGQLATDARRGGQRRRRSVRWQPPVFGKPRQRVLCQHITHDQCPHLHAAIRLIYSAMAARRGWPGVSRKQFPKYVAAAFQTPSRRARLRVQHSEAWGIKLVIVPRRSM